MCRVSTALLSNNTLPSQNDNATAQCENAEPKEMLCYIYQYQTSKLFITRQLRLAIVVQWREGTLVVDQINRTPCSAPNLRRELRDTRDVQRSIPIEVDDRVPKIAPLRAIEAAIEQHLEDGPIVVNYVLQ